MRRLPRLVLAFSLLPLLAPGGPAARAEDAPPARGPVEIRVYPVGALVRPHPWYLPDRGPYPAGPVEVNDVTDPLYGGESEEGAQPYGSANELLEALRASTGAPGAWEAGEVSVVATDAPALLFLEAPVSLHEEVAARLGEWAREACATLVVDVAVLEGDLAVARGPSGLAGAVASGALRPLGFARILPSTHGAGTARDGGRQAFLQDYDTEVACECNVPDPIVGVAPQGLAARAAVTPSGQGRWVVHVQGWWADAPTFAPRAIQGGFVFGDRHAGPTVPTPPGGDKYEVVTARGEAFRVPFALAEGVWDASPLAGGRVLAARLRVLRPDLPAWRAGSRSACPPDLAGERYTPFEALPPLGALETHAFDLRDLLFDPVPSRHGRLARIAPSNYTPPEPKELPEPTPALPGEQVAWLLERTVAPAPADAEGPSLQVGPRLVARTDAARAAALGEVLAALRRNHLRTTRVEATLLALPLGALPEVWGDPDRAGAFAPGDLLARPGARVLERMALDLRGGQRLAAVAGAERSYLGDYDVEIACTTTIGNPVMQEFFAGASLDLHLEPVLTSPLVSVLVRFDRGVLREMRRLPTRFGDLEAPSLLEQSLRGAVTLAPDRTVLFGLSASGGEATLLLLRASR